MQTSAAGTSADAAACGAAGLSLRFNRYKGESVSRDYMKMLTAGNLGLFCGCSFIMLLVASDLPLRRC